MKNKRCLLCQKDIMQSKAEWHERYYAYKKYCSDNCRVIAGSMRMVDGFFKKKNIEVWNEDFKNIVKRVEIP